MEVASVLLDAHTEDQKKHLKHLLSYNPATYDAEDVLKSTDLYNKTYQKQEPCIY